MSNDQLQLPYEVIEEKKVAGRNFLRENFSVSSKVAYKIPFDKLQIRDGFNKRITYDGIAELAASIKANGLSEPLTVDVLTDGRVLIEKGHRRYKALKLLIEQGENIDLVECYPNSGKVTEKQRMQDVFNSNMFSLKLNTVEQANTVFDLKNNFGKVSNQDIADSLGISRQQVDNLLLIAQADDALKNQILMTEIGVADALKMIRENKKAAKQSIDAEVDANKNKAGKTSHPYDPNKEELAELKELEGASFNGIDDLPFDENAELKLDDDSDTRVSTHVPKEKENGKPLKLVGSSLSKEKNNNDNDDIVKYDETRVEIQQVNNCIKLADKIEAVITKLDVPEGVKIDIANYVKWLQNDLSEVRTFIHKNKPQNKRGS